MTTLENQQREMLTRIIIGKIDAAVALRRAAKLKAKAESEQREPVPPKVATAPAPEPPAPTPVKKTHANSPPSYAYYHVENVGVWSGQWWGPV